MSQERELKIEEPCHKRWAELKGAGARRFCGECSLHVVDGSALTKREAEALVETSTERVCMRVALDEQGQAVHAPEKAKDSKRALAGWGLALASGMLVACTDEPAAPETPTEEPTEPGTTDQGAEEPLERPIEILGEICYVEEPEPVDEASTELPPGDLENPAPNAEVMGRMRVLHLPEEEGH